MSDVIIEVKTLEVKNREALFDPTMRVGCLPCGDEDSDAASAYSEPLAAQIRPWAMADSGPGGGGGGDVEAAKDPGALKSHSSITDAEMMGHHNVLMGLPLSGRSVRSRHGRHSRGGKG